MKYTTDCFRKVKDEDGTVRVARMVEERSVVLTVTGEKGNRFWKGARVGGAA